MSGPASLPPPRHLRCHPSSGRRGIHFVRCSKGYSRTLPVPPMSNTVRELVDEIGTGHPAIFRAFHRTSHGLSTSAGSRTCPPLAFGLGRRLKRLNMHKWHVSLAQIGAGQSAFVSAFHRTSHGLSTNAGSQMCPPLVFGLGRRLKRLNMHKSHVSLAQIGAGQFAFVSAFHRTSHGLSTNAGSRTCPPRFHKAWRRAAAGRWASR